MIPVCIEDLWVDLSTWLSPDRILHMRLVSLVNLCTLHLSLISKLYTEFCGILSRLLGKGYASNRHLLLSAYEDADWAGSPTDRRCTTGYWKFLGGNLVTCKSKKQTVVARSSAEAEYRAMAHTACKLIWLKTLLSELGVEVVSS